MQQMAAGRDRQHLIFDADDTLWENNVLFEQVIDEFIAWLDHPELDPAGVRAALDEIERAHTVQHGYGTRVFTLTLEVAVSRLHQRELTAADREAIARLMTRLAWEQIDVIPGVPETLAELSARHDLLLLTKGDHVEQTRKIERSGLAHLFRRTLITPEKTAATYRDLVAAESLDPERTWMIGNSPRSDILPAVAAGLRAVFVPNAYTWRLELDELPDRHDRILQLPDFRALAGHF
jgi:putative hydrolase of the HAD superfamily